MKFPIVIHKDRESDYGVTVPDLPGCFSAGNSFDEAMEQSKEAILCHLEGMMIDNEQIPLPKKIEDYYRNKDYKGGTWALIEVNLSIISGKTKRVNITIPERLLNQMDSFASSHGNSRSGLIVQATMEFMTKYT